MPEYPQALYLLARLHKSLSEPAGERQAYQALLKVPAKSDPYRIAGLLALADIYLAANDADAGLGGVWGRFEKCQPMREVVRWPNNKFQKFVPRSLNFKIRRIHERVELLGILQISLVMPVLLILSVIVMVGVFIERVLYFARMGNIDPSV
jgi:hypothetical protein